MGLCYVQGLGFPCIKDNLIACDARFGIAKVLSYYV